MVPSVCSTTDYLYFIMFSQKYQSYAQDLSIYFTEVMAMDKWLEQTPEVFVFLTAVILLFVVGRLFLSPFRTAILLAGNGMLGILSLVICQLLSIGTGFNIALNGVTLAVCTLLGIPGAAALAFIQWLGI